MYPPTSRCKETRTAFRVVPINSIINSNWEIVQCFAFKSTTLGQRTISAAAGLPFISWNRNKANFQVTVAGYKFSLDNEW